MSNEMDATDTWERGHLARRSVDDVDAGGTPALPGVVRLTLGTNNVYALPGDDGVTLIDAGPDYEGAWEELHAQLDAHGLEPARVHTVLLTHHHLDHAGLAARWQAAGARILVGAADAPALAMTDAAREQERTRARQELLRHGVPPAALATRPTSGERYTRWAAPLRMTPVEADALLEDGACIGGTHHMRSIAAPGHTPGTLLFLDTGAGALFTGDHVLPRMAPTSGIQFEGTQRRPSLPAYLTSLRATRALNSQTVAVYPGHGKPFADLAEAIDWTVRLLEQRARRALTQLRRGPATAYEVAHRMFPHLGSRHLRPTMAEVIGLLDLLAERDLARAVVDGDLVTWQATAPEGEPPHSDTFPPHPL